MNNKNSASLARTPIEEKGKEGEKKHKLVNNKQRAETRKTS